MSATTTTVVPPIGAPNATTGAPTTPADQAVGLARNVPDLISKAATLDPALASKWTGKALLQSKTLWGSLLVIIVTAAAKRYALGWDANTVDVVAGAIDFAIFAGLRKISDGPITGWFRKATISEAIATAETASVPTP